MPAGLFVKETDAKIPLPWIAGQTWWFDTVVMALKVWTGTDWLVIGAPGATLTIPYDIGLTTVGVPPVEEAILRYPCPRDISFAEDMPLSHATAKVAATADTVFSIRIDAGDTGSSVEFGTLTYPAGSRIGVFDSTAQDFVAGDVLLVVSPATPDATLAGLGGGLAATREGTIGGGGGGTGGEELLVNKNATNGYAGLSGGLIAVVQIPPSHGHTLSEGPPGAGTVATAGQVLIDTTNGRAYFGVAPGGNYTDFGSLGHAFNQITDGTNSASATGSETLKFEQGVNVKPTVTAGSPDKVVHEIEVSGQTNLDLFMYDGANWTRLPGPTADGQVLTRVSGALAWV